MRWKFTEATTEEEPEGQALTRAGQAQRYCLRVPRPAICVGSGAAANSETEMQMPRLREFRRIGPRRCALLRGRNDHAAGRGACHYLEVVGLARVMLIASAARRASLCCVDRADSVSRCPVSCDGTNGKLHVWGHRDGRHARNGGRLRRRNSRDSFPCRLPHPTIEVPPWPFEETGPRGTESKQTVERVGVEAQ